jgi:hypothetical protein
MPIGIKVKDIQARSLDIDYFEVTWKIENTSEDVLDYTFQLFRSEAPAGPFDAVSEEMDDRYVYVDNHIRTGNTLRQWYYQVRVKRKDSGEYEDFGPASPGPDADLIALELRKHVNLLMKEFTGRRCWVFPVRTFGQRCSCFNTTLQKKTRSGCITCFDTGFIRGYHTPIEAWISIDPNPATEQTTNVGATQQSDTTARLGFFPPVKHMDLIVEPDNLRWRVGSKSGTEQVRAPIHQEIRIHQIPPTDIEYKLAFDTGEALSNMWLSPPRNFSNPHTLESFTNEDYADIYQLYTGFPR